MINKTMTRQILESSLDMKKAFILCRANGTEKLSNMVGSEFTIEDYVLYDSHITSSDDETGEVSEDIKHCLLLSTSIGLIGTASNSAIPTFKDYLNSFGIEELRTMTFKVIRGTTAKGNFNTIEAIF